VTSQEQMSELWTLYGGQVWRGMLVAAAGRRDLADEVTAEAFSRLITRVDTVRDPLAWLFRCAYRLLTDEYRREQRARTAGAHASRPVVAAELDPTLVQALSALDPKLRLCIFLHYFADLSIGEVARLSGASVPAVKVRLHRARAQLRTALIELEEIHA
jgi:RNA polymerase sigma-70 factor, ECF subfamily